MGLGAVALELRLPHALYLRSALWRHSFVRLAILPFSYSYIFIYTSRRTRLGSILLEESTVEIDLAAATLTIMTKTKHKFTFRGRTLRDLKKWKEVRIAVIATSYAITDIFTQGARHVDERNPSC